MMHLFSCIFLSSLTEYISTAQQSRILSPRASTQQSCDEEKEQDETFPHHPGEEKYRTSHPQPPANGAETAAPSHHHKLESGQPKVTLCIIFLLLPEKKVNLNQKSRKLRSLTWNTRKGQISPNFLKSLTPALSKTVSHLLRERYSMVLAASFNFQIASENKNPQRA